NRRSRPLRRDGRGITPDAEQNGHRTADQLRRQRRQSIVLPIGPAKLDDDVLTLDEAGLAQALAECSHKVSGIRRRSAAHEADHRQRGLLRARPERPGRRYATENTEKFPPSHARSPPAPAQLAAYAGTCRFRKLRARLFVRAFCFGGSVQVNTYISAVCSSETRSIDTC